MRYFLLALLTLSVLLLLFCNTRETDTSIQMDTGIADTSINEYEIIKNIRLLASETKTWGGFGWVREAEDSIFTVRDDVKETCYKGPENKDVKITFDIYTTFHKKIPLSSINLTYRSSGDMIFEVSLSDTCYDPETFKTSTKFAEPLNLNGRNAGCVILNFYSYDRTEICSVSLTTTMKPDITRDDFYSNTYTTDKNYGVIEGFYGVMWSDTEREKIFKTLSRYGLGMYVYAPKDEIRHRSRWREDYLEEDMKRFIYLQSKAIENKVDFYYAISPFIDFDYQSKEDFQILLNKLKKFVNVGITNIAIFADDIEMEKEIRVNAELGKIHTEITNNILAELKKINSEVRMLFVGTVYSDERSETFEDGKGYLKEIANLNPEIKIFWTGLKTSGATLSEEDTNLFTLITGRKPLIWDNFWANDGGDGFFANLYLSEYTGRIMNLLNKTDGIGINPLIQGSFSRLNLMKFGRWKQQNNEDRWSENEIKWFGFQNKLKNIDYFIENLELLSEIYNGNSNKDIQFEKLDAAIEKLRSAINNNSKENIQTGIKQLYKIFAKMYVLQSVLYYSNIDSELFDEIFYPSEKIRYDAITGFYALQFLMSKLNHQTDYSLKKKMELSLEKSSSQRFYYSAGKLNNFIEYISNIEFEENLNISLPKIKDRLPQSCNINKQISFSPFTGENNLELYGLPKEYYSIKEHTITFNIPIAGNYAIAIIGETEDGINVLWGNILCK